MYICHACEHASSMKLGKCPSCGQFWTFIKDTFSDKKWTGWWSSLQKKQNTSSVRWPMTIPEFQRLFGVWVQQWWLYLLWWEPGIGKSTLILQIINDLQSSSPLSVWYFSWEEMESQIQARKDRLQLEHTIDIYHTNSVEDIIATVKEKEYACIIIDSIQMIHSSQSDSLAWSPSQVKACSEYLSEQCKAMNVCCRILWHVTKWWEIAWPKYLEHLVDVVLYLEWDRSWSYRFLRCRKNRFGHTDEVWVFEMTALWLTPVYDMQQKMLSLMSTDTPWSVISLWLDNGRPLFITVEVLLNKSHYKFPQRSAHGIDTSRLNLLIAILEKHLWLKIWYYDVYVNIPWWLVFRDSWLDLAVAAAIYSQQKNLTISNEIVFIGEIWLGWQILPSKFHQKRIKEAGNLTVIDHTSLKHISHLPNKL